MDSERIDQQLEFLKEIDALKGVLRASPIIDRTRRENTAEHSWHVAMYALVLAEHAPPGTDISRVIQMLLIHDIVEIDAGDVPFHSSYDPALRLQHEQNAADRLFGVLPDEQYQRLRTLWDEFEAGESADARFAKALDRLQPVVQNIETQGGTWSDFEVTEEQVYERCGPPIETGSPALWKRTREIVRDFFKGGDDGTA